jgi:Ca-activated chloride channel family protein
VRDAAGKPVTSKLDDSRLKEIASSTGGFFTLISPDAAREIFQKGIEPMELGESGVFSARQPVERYQWPLAAATACLMLSLLPGDRRRRGYSTMAALFLILSPCAQAQSGLQEYQKGNFDKAGSAFQEELKKQPNSRALQFNTGAAAYKTGDFEKAISNFTEALLSEDKKLREDSSYNLANSLVRKGEAAKENDAKRTNWKNALEHYDETLRLNPNNKPAAENRDITKKLLEELDKKEQQQKNQDQKKQDQKDQKDKKNDKQQDQKDQQKQDQKDSKNGDNKDQDKQNSKDQKDGQQKQGANRIKISSRNRTSSRKKTRIRSRIPKRRTSLIHRIKSKLRNHPTKRNSQLQRPRQRPVRKRRGNSKPPMASSLNLRPSLVRRNNSQGQPVKKKEGQISPSQARALLNSLRGEEEKVNLMEQQQSSQDVLRDW